MTCFRAKVMATVLVAVFLLVGGIHILPTSASLPYGGRKSLSPQYGSTKAIPRLQGSFEGLNISSKEIVFFRSLKEGLSPPPPPTGNRQNKPGLDPGLDPAPPPPQIL